MTQRRLTLATFLLLIASCSVAAATDKPNPEPVPKYIPFDPDRPQGDVHATSRKSQPKTTVQPETQLSERQLERKKRRELRSAKKK